MRQSRQGKPLSVYSAIVADLAIAAAKFVAAIATGSSAVLAEAIHSVVDLSNGGLILIGHRRARRPASRDHPFGHGKELYFWALIVAVLIFGVGGGMSLLEGVYRLRHPEENRSPTWGYVVLGLSFFFELGSWLVASRALRRERRSEHLVEAARLSKDPGKFVVFGEDSAALLGNTVAGVGLFLSDRLQSHLPDAIATMMVGVILAGVALALAFESKQLLVGESADPDVVRAIAQIVREKPFVVEIGPPLTMHLGPHEILLNIDVRFEPALGADELANAVGDLERSIRSVCPDVTRIYIEANLFDATPFGMAGGRVATRAHDDARTRLARSPR